MLRDDRGSVTVEAAIVLGALVSVAAAIFAGVATMTAQLRAIDIAAAAARAESVGAPFTPPDGARVDTSTDAGLVTVSVTVDAPLMSMTASAIRPVEVAPS